MAMYAPAEEPFHIPPPPHTHTITCSSWGSEQLLELLYICSWYILSYINV